MATNKTGLTTGVVPDGRQRHNRLYVWNGRDRMLKYDGETWVNCGIDKTASFTPTLTPASPSGAGISGTYYYYVVPVNESAHVSGAEYVSGNPSGRFGPVTVNAQKVAITNLPSSHSDSQVTHFYLYRNKNGYFDSLTDDEFEDFWYVGKVAVGTTSFDDEVEDDSLPPLTMSFYNEIPPTFKMGAVFGDRLFGAGFDAITAGTATKDGSNADEIDFSGVTIPTGVVGCKFQAENDGAVYTIIERNSSSTVTLDRDFSGSLSGGNYSIFRPCGELYFSEFNNFDAWGREGEGFRNRLIVGGPGSCQDITALATLNGSLWVFTLDAIYQVYGKGVDQTAIKITPDPYFDGIGCVGWQAIWSVDNELYFMSLRGPMRFRGDGPPEFIGEAVGLNQLENEVENDSLELICVGSDGRKVWFCMPATGDAENSIVYVYDRITNTWWQDDGYHPSSFVFDRNADGEQALFYTQGPFLVELESGTNDGVPSGTTEGNATSSTTTSLTDSGASFYTTGSGLQERYIHIYNVDSNGIPTSLVGKRRIASNTGTAITWSSSGVGGGTLTVPSGAKYYIGAINWYWTTKNIATPGKRQRALQVFINYDLQGEGTASRVWMTPLVDNEPDDDGPASHQVDQALMKFMPNRRGHEIAVKVEGREPDAEIAIRSINIDSITSEADK